MPTICRINVSAAGQQDILVSPVPMPIDKNGVWLWAAIDNLRVSAVYRR